MATNEYYAKADQLCVVFKTMVPALNQSGQLSTADCVAIKRFVPALCICCCLQRLKLLW